MTTQAIHPLEGLIEAVEAMSSLESYGHVVKKAKVIALIRQYQARCEPVAIEQGADEENERLQDETGIWRISQAMKKKLSLKREQGRGGWWNGERCEISFLEQLFWEHVEKGDIIDIANFCMMLFNRGLTHLRPNTPTALRHEPIKSAMRSHVYLAEYMTEEELDKAVDAVIEALQQPKQEKANEGIR